MLTLLTVLWVAGVTVTFAIRERQRNRELRRIMKRLNQFLYEQENKKGQTEETKEKGSDP